jgi:hypothetical protein
LLAYVSILMLLLLYGAYENSQRQ